MSSVDRTAIPSFPPARSRLVTAMALAIVAISALAVPISVVAFSMVWIKSPGLAPVDLIGWTMVVVGPSAALVGGIGLLRRQRWSWFYVLALSAVSIAVNTHQIVRPPTEPSVHYSPDGVITTIPSPGAPYAPPAVVVAGALAALMLSPRVAAEFGASQR